MSLTERKTVAYWEPLRLLKRAFKNSCDVSRHSSHNFRVFCCLGLLKWAFFQIFVTPFCCCWFFPPKSIILKSYSSSSLGDFIWQKWELESDVTSCKLEVSFHVPHDMVFSVHAACTQACHSSCSVAMKCLNYREWDKKNLSDRFFLWKNHLYICIWRNVICLNALRKSKWSITKSNDVSIKRENKTKQKNTSGLFFSFGGDYSDWCEPYHFTVKFMTSKNSFFSWHHNMASENQTVVTTNREQLHSDTE